MSLINKNFPICSIPEDKAIEDEATISTQASKQPSTFRHAGANSKPSLRDAEVSQTQLNQLNSVSEAVAEFKEKIIDQYQISFEEHKISPIPTHILLAPLYDYRPEEIQSFILDFENQKKAVDQAKDSETILMSAAPPGSGKSTLLGQMAQEKGYAFIDYDKNSLLKIQGFQKMKASHTPKQCYEKYRKASQVLHNCLFAYALSQKKGIALAITNTSDFFSKTVKHCLELGYKQADIHHISCPKPARLESNIIRNANDDFQCTHHDLLDKGQAFFNKTSEYLAQPNLALWFRSSGHSAPQLGASFHEVNDGNEKVSRLHHFDEDIVFQIIQAHRLESIDSADQLTNFVIKSLLNCADDNRGEKNFSEAMRYAQKALKFSETNDQKAIVHRFFARIELGKLDYCSNKIKSLKKEDTQFNQVQINSYLTQGAASYQKALSFLSKASHLSESFSVKESVKLQSYFAQRKRYLLDRDPSFVPLMQQERGQYMTLVDNIDRDKDRIINHHPDAPTLNPESGLSPLGQWATWKHNRAFVRSDCPENTQAHISEDQKKSLLASAVDYSDALPVRMDENVKLGSMTLSRLVDLYIDLGHLEEAANSAIESYELIKDKKLDSERLNILAINIQKLLAVNLNAENNRDKLSVNTQRTLNKIVTEIQSRI